MKVCYFGTYTLDEGYPVNRTILNALREAGCEVVECHATLWHRPQDRWKGGKWFWSPFFWARLFGAYLMLVFKYLTSGPHDLLMVGYLGHQDVFLASFLNLWRRRPVVFVAFNSLYETVVVDRRLLPHHKFLAPFLRWMDKSACRMADQVLLDTRAHIDYFCREFDLPRSKFQRVFVGSILPSGKVSDSDGLDRSPLEVLFLGTFMPLHGIETIIRAASLLGKETEIQFTMIGNGQSYSQMRELHASLGVRRMKFVDQWVPASELVTYLVQTDVCLGIFGAGEKAQNVIPCKVFDYLALGKPVITADTPACRELLTHRKDSVLTPPADAQALANAILMLKNDPNLKRSIARQGQETFVRHCSPRAIGQTLMDGFSCRFP